MTIPSNEAADAGNIGVTHVILACDESGAKGYAEAGDVASDDLGVFGGIMVPAAHLAAVQPEFDALAAKYASADGKLHITDLSEQDQASLRGETYDLIRKHKLPCFYEAIHVAGFNSAHSQLRDAVNAARKGQTSSVKMSSNPPAAPSLHVTLFEGIYSKVVAFCMERGKTRLHIEVRTDRVDSPIVAEFEAAAKKLTDNGATVKEVTGFDTRSKQVVRGTVSVGPASNSKLPVTIEKFELRVRDDSDGLVVAADVVVNSLYYLFRNRPADEKYRALNTPEAFARHPLRDCLDSFYRWDGYNMPDTFYRHPRDPDLR